MTTTKRQHPSVRLQNGEARTFDEAMDIYVAQYREELLQNREIYRDYHHQNDDEQNARWRKEIQEQSEAVDHIEGMVNHARAIYHATVNRALQQAAQKMRGIHDRTLDEIANAVESGDWSQLAI